MLPVLPALLRWPMVGLCLWLLACSNPPGEPPAAEDQGAIAGPDATVVETLNRGVGLMGRFAYGEARAIFAALAAQYPAWADLQVNLAIATLNRQQEGDESAALAQMDALLKVHPDHLRAHYVAGLLRLYLESPQEALGHFQRVAEADPKDAYAAYYLAQCLAQQFNYTEALTWYRRALALDPYLRSAYYGAFQTLQRLQRPEEARAMIADYQRLANNPRAHLAEFKYTRMGPKGNVLPLDTEPPALIPPPPGPLFAPPHPLPMALPPGGAVPWRLEDKGRRPTSVTTADFQGDGYPDLFLANVLAGDHLHNLVLLGTEGGFRPDLDHPLARIASVNAALWGDFDNDGRTDVYLCRQGPNQLWRQTESGSWEDVTGITQTAGGDQDTLDGVFYDADHDGDLDLFLVNAAGHNELLNNNLDGTFRPLAQQQGIAGDGRGSRSLLVVDIEGDRDADVVVIHDPPPQAVYLNDRLWEYHPAPGFERLQSFPVGAAVSGDLNADGETELYTLTPEGDLHRWRWRNPGKPEYLGNTGHRLANGWLGMAVVEVDGDGVLELLVASRAGWSLLQAGEAALKTLFQAEVEEGLAGLTPLFRTAASGPAMVGLPTRGPALIWDPGPGRYPFLALTLSGRQDAAQAMRSNASGLGARVAVRVDSRWTLLETLARGVGPGQSHQPLAVGLKGARRADFITIDWSDGVMQSEVDLAAGHHLHRITETQRQLSSCPVLFVWDGQRYAFVSDFLGVGGVGYALGRGLYAIPRPWENLLLQAGLPAPRQGRYLVKLSEPMEEVAYIDGVQLVAYDLPPDWQMVLDERLATGEPAPTGEARFYRQELLPVQAHNERGQEVTETLLQTDGRAAPPGELDQRFIGRLLKEHVLTLQFPVPLDTYPGTPLLVADGWVEYPYSQTQVAAWQAGAGYHPPALEARGADGIWRTLLPAFGYPAGMPRRMSVPLIDLPPGTKHLRLRTNLQIYWDRLAVVLAEQPADSKRRILPLQRAVLAQTGFARRTTAAQQKPLYDYEQRTPLWDTRYMAGYYTRFGRVDALVARVDDALAVFGPGEELHLEFGVPPQSLPPGWTRRLVLRTHGWTKDMDLFTRTGETVGPLPEAGLPGGARKRLHPRYLNRYQSGY